MTRGKRILIILGAAWAVLAVLGLFAVLNAGNCDDA